MIELTTLNQDTIATIPELAALVAIATSDYDTFWFTISEQDRQLTGSLTGDDSYDTIVVIDDCVYELTWSETRFEVGYVGPKAELKLFCNPVNTGLEPDQIEDFVEALAYSLPGVECLKGQSSGGGTSRLQWLLENRYVDIAWEAALDSL